MQVNCIKFHSTNSKIKQNKATQNLSFKANITDKLFGASVMYHRAQIWKTNPLNIEKYFESIGIPASFREGDEFAKKMVAYGCYHASKIFDQLHYVKPNYLGIADFRKIYPKGQKSTGFCTVYPSDYEGTHYPERAVMFNTISTYIGKDRNIPVPWIKFFDACKQIKESNTWASGHFLTPFIHEFSHSFHFDKIFSKFGAPNHEMMYPYNPKSSMIIDKLLLQIDKNNPFVSYSVARMISENISDYGTTKLAETLAEGFSKKILEKTDLFTLRLTENPFPLKQSKSAIDEILKEAEEGLVGDGKGYV